MSSIESESTLRSVIPRNRFGLSLVICALCLLTSSRSRAAQDLPDGKGATVVREKCISCHRADVIVSQRLSKPGWEREVEKMMRWGAAVVDADRDSLVEYLSANFGQTRSNLAAASESDAGKIVYDRACLRCHQSDLAQQQRLSRPGWANEVDKMIRWGAAVTASEKESLVGYLSRSFPPRPIVRTN
jgi:cytochrome c5